MVSQSYLYGLVAGIYLTIVLLMGLELLFDVFRFRRKTPTTPMRLAGCMMLTEVCVMLIADIVAAVLEDISYCQTTSSLSSHILFILVSLAGASVLHDNKFPKKTTTAIISIPFIVCFLLGISGITSLLLSSAISIGWYIAVTAWMGVKLWMHDRSMKDNYSNMENKSKSWYTVTAILIIINAVIYLYLEWKGSVGYTFPYDIIYWFYILGIYTFFTVNVMKNSDVPKGKEVVSDEEGNNEEPLVKYEGLKQRLDEILLTEFIYRDKEITADKLAKMLNSNTNTLYYFLHDYLHTNFYDMINDYRIEEAKLLLTDSDEKIAIIAYKVGYNTPQVFYRNFKKSTGMTPAEWRNLQGEVKS